MTKRAEIHTNINPEKQKNEDARTQDRGAFTLGNLTVRPGERVSTELTIGGEFPLPVTVIRGEKPGKTVLVTAGIHPGEYVGIQSAIELSRDLKTEKMAGTVILVKVVCRDDFERRRGSAGMADNRNLNRLFPGNKDGRDLERLAFSVVKELHSLADFYIDLHCGDDYEELVPYVYYAGMADPSVVKISREMALQVDVAYMVKSDVASGGSYNYAASCGIPSILMERGGMGGWSAEEVRSMKRDVRSVLRYLGVYDGHKSYRKYYPLEVKDVIYQSAAQDGLWYPAKKAGDLIREGDILGVVRDYEGKELETSVAYSDGVVLYQTASLQVLRDGPMVTYGRISYEADLRKERIVSYWSKRSESFLVQRRHELHSPLAGRWLAEIRRWLPVSEKKAGQVSLAAGNIEELRETCGRRADTVDSYPKRQEFSECVEHADERRLRILDVGCGAGFFTILLAKEGYKTTGVDMTPEMIENAKKLAEEEGADCDFYVMDAEHLTFPDAGFDVVISRNLTWTLPDAARGYQEWLRVLVPGGILLNFDANYGAENLGEMSALPENHAHKQLGDAMMAECEDIRRQLPISAYSRPAWDVETLGRLSLEQISLDLGISRRIYLEKDEFYNPTPLFSLCGWKSK